MFLFGARKKTFALHRFLTPKTAFLKHFESKCPFISVYLRTKRRSKILSDEVWVGGSWIISLRRLIFEPRKTFYNFSF